MITNRRQQRSFVSPLPLELIIMSEVNVFDDTVIMPALAWRHTLGKISNQSPITFIILSKVSELALEIKRVPIFDKMYKKLVFRISVRSVASLSFRHAIKQRYPYSVKLHFNVSVLL